MDILIEECCEQPDEDGYFPYEGSGLSNSGQPCSRCYKKTFSSSTPEFLGEVGLNLELGLVTSCCRCQTA